MPDMKRKIRIVMAKPGLDGHDRGIKVLAAAYRDAGMEVIYLGLRQTPEMIVSSALQEDADVIALSSLNNAHNTIFINVLELMEQKGLDNVLLVGGGIIPKKDFNKIVDIIDIATAKENDLTPYCSEKCEGKGLK